MGKPRIFHLTIWGWLNTHIYNDYNGDGFWQWVYHITQLIYISQYGSEDATQINVMWVCLMSEGWVAA